MSNRNLPIDLIRTLITISEVGGYTRAAQVLGRTQPAITLQIKRLEALVNAKLVSQVGQKSILTDDGQLLAVYGRKILRLNDDAIARFSPQTSGDTLRIGLPTDFATAFLQDALMHFGRQTSAVALRIHCNLSARLLEDLHEDEHDIIIALYSDEDNQYLFHHWSQQPIWACAEQFELKKQEPVPIIAHHEGCAYRDRMTSILARERRQWNIVFSAPGIAELQSAVLAAFGVTALTRTTMLHGMREMGIDEGFPPLPPIQLGIFYRHSQMSEAGSKLIRYLNEHLTKLAELDTAI